MAFIGILQTGCASGSFPPGQGTGNSSGGGNGGTITNPPVGVQIAVSPSSATVAPGGQISLNATVTNATNTGVTWDVNGTPGGNQTVGTISTNGGYTAPQVAPVPNSVVVTATSSQDSTKKASALVIISAPPTTVTVAASPTSVTLQTGASTVFTAVVSGTANTAVTWTVNGIPGGNAILGTITGTGVYTAPNAVPVPATVTIQAVSVADPAASGTASVTIQQRVQVSVSPTNATVGTFLTQQFTATVTGSANTAVSWAVNGVAGGNSTFGTIAATGLFTAPATAPSPGVVSISATSLADPTVTAFATLSILASPGVAVSVFPGVSPLNINDTFTFTATVSGLFNGNPPSNLVSWHANSIPGGDATSGFIVPTPCPVPGPTISCGLYTAPAAVPLPNTVLITAYSITDPGASGTASITITAPAVVNVSVAPSTANVQVSTPLVGNTQQFTAAVTGTVSQGVTWSLSGSGCPAACGTISGAGLYTAPTALPAGNVTVTAASVVNPASTGTATITVTAAPPPIAVAVSPTGGSVRVSNQLQFSASVSGTPNQSVTWRVNGVTGGNATFGTITPAGLYTAPVTVPAGGTATISAQSAVAPNPTGSSTVTILPPSTITMNPSSATVQVGLGVQFFVTVTGLVNTAVTYAVNGVVGGNASVGTISTSGLYIAPAAAPTPNPVSVTATSVANPSLVATSLVTVVVPVTVAVAPATASVALSGTQQYTATVTGSANQSVTWSVNGIVGGNATVGTIDATGLYTAPTNLLLTQSFTITARSVADPTASGNASVTVNVPVAVTIAPATATRQVGQAQLFSATVTGTANTAVTWSVGGVVGGNATVGTISTGGNYIAPAAVPATNPVTVTATSVADPTKSASAAVTITPGVSVSVSPAAVSLTTCVPPTPPATCGTQSTQTFTATVTGAPGGTTVTWSVGGACGATCGTIVPATGAYTAPATVPLGPVTVTATSTDASATTDTATVTVTAPISVTISPTPTVTLNVSQSQPFSATVTGTANQSVSWTVNGILGGNSTVGTITAGGNYTAPASVPAVNPVTITATSAADPTASASTSATITALPAGVFVSVFPRNRNLPIGKTQQFKAHVIRANNQAVTWAVNGIAGGNSTVGAIDNAGLYAPPSTQPALPNITITATSVAVPAASMTVNARIVPDVTVSPASLKVRGGQTQQFTATVNGTSNSAVVWAVNGVVGGGAATATISATGLLTASTSIPTPPLLTLTATSAADANAVGVATVNILANATQLFPTSPQVLPGGHLLFQVNTHFLPPPTSTSPLVTWTVNGIAGGNATVGTITPAGLYTAPATPQTVTIEATSTVDATRRVNTPVTIVVPTGASPVGALGTMTKIRPYDNVSGAASLTVPAAGNQYASWQVLVEGRSEDLTGVNVSVSDFVSGSGNRIAASNAVIYLEKYVNAFYASRAQGDVGEWPDPLIPKVDPFVNEVRNAFPFAVNRISPAYKQYPRNGGETSNVNLGAGRATSGGAYSGSTVKHFVVSIDRTGPVGSATFRWSNDGGATFQQSNVLTSSSPVALSDGVTVSFQPGGIAGITDFVVGNTFWIFAGPRRNQPVWIDLFVPGNVPAGSYNGTVTVVRGGKANVTLNITVAVSSFVLPVTSTIPSYFGMNWNSLLNAHFNVASGPQTLQLGQFYGFACLINRVSCDTASAFPPTFTFDAATGAVTSSSYNAYDQATAGLANGSITPHGEQLSALRLPRAGSTTSEQYFATENLLNSLNTRGWRSRVFDFSFDEPGTPADFQSAMGRSSLVRSVDPALRSVVTTDISQFNGNLVGYVNRWTPNWASMDKKEFLDGPNNSSRSFYNRPIASGDELWWYGSCLSHDCNGTGASPRFDTYSAFAVDTSALLNRSWGLLSISPYQTRGVLYQDSVLAYGRSFNMTQPQVDVWDSTYYLGGNGEGTLFYPGRPANIGGITHVPVESLRLKHIRDAMVDQELAAFLINRGDLLFVQSTIRSALYLSNFVIGPDPAEYLTASTNLLNQTTAPPAPAPITVPAAGGCYIDSFTGNRVCRVTDRPLCARGAHHYYAYWPIFNSTGTHLIAECLTWVGRPTASATALLVRNSDLAVLGNALQGISSVQQARLAWSWTRPDTVYGFGTGASGGRLFEINPFTNANVLLKDFRGMTFFGRTISDMRLAYNSFDDRFFLLELLNSGAIILGTWDRQTDTVLGTLDTGQFSFYDESVFFKDNFVWVRGTDFSNVPNGFRYTLDFSSRTRVSEGGHYAHGTLPNGNPVSVKASSNRSCPAASISGIPGNSWKPTAVVMNPLIDTTGATQNADPLASVVLKLGCNYPGQHNFDHFSWNNNQTDRFFITSSSYSGFATDVLADSVLRVRLQFNAGGQIIGDIIDRIALHHSEDNKYGYFAKPRTSCNVQGTRCIFSSSMTFGTNNADPQEHLYVVDVP